ncbi:hypothetical protein ABZP36_017810 [Zizania latifolia]
MAAAAGGGGAARALSQREQDIQMMLAADVHLGTKNCDFQMERYVYKRRSDGTHLPTGISLLFPSSCSSMLTDSHCHEISYVDLFFYRDPEEAKEQEEEAPAAADFAAITDYTAPEQWPADQWTSDVAVPPAATGAEWGAAPAPVAAADGWDQAGAPVAAEGAAVPPVAPTGWDTTTQPTAQGWE